MALTEKQKIFANEYLIDLNATRAYKEAYKSCKKDSTANVNGSNLLRNTKVADYISERMAEREKRTEITQDKVLKELAAVAFTDGSQYAKVIEKQAVITNEVGTRVPLFDEDDNPVMVQDVELVLTDKLTDTQKKAISCIKKGKNGIEIATCDKVRALELLGRHMGMWKDKVEVSGLDKEKDKLDSILHQMRGDG